ncbi:unnamed protein product, partial [Tilletia controversa]
NIQHQALAAAHAFWERQQHDAHQQSLVAQQHEDQQRLHLFQQGQAVRAQEEVARRNEEIRQVAFRHQLERQRQDDDRRQQRERDWEHAQAGRRQAEQQPLQQYRNYEAQPARQQAQQGQHAPQHTRLHDQQLPQDNSIQQSQRLTTLQGQNLVAMAQTFRWLTLLILDLDSTYHRTLQQKHRDDLITKMLLDPFKDLYRRIFHRHLLR